jgi:hypothetical protein
MAHDGNGDPTSQLTVPGGARVVLNARKMVELVTTVLMSMYRALNDVALRDAINHGYIVGPRMVAGAYITITRSGGDDWIARTQVAMNMAANSPWGSSKSGCWHAGADP